MNAIELLKQDHRTVRELFAAHQGAGESAVVEKRTAAERIFKELEAHTQVEEEIFYPAARDGATTDTDKLLAEAYEEHQVAKNLIAELKSTTPGDEQWDAKVKVLQEAIEHHVEEEEGELFPKVRAALGSSYLDELGTRMAARKRELTAPSPSLSGSLVKLVTRAYDSLTGNGKPAKRARRTAAGKRASAARTPLKRAKSTVRVAKKAATKATTKTKRAVRSVAARAVSSAKKARGSRPVSTVKKTATRAKTRVAAGRARAAKMIKTTRKRAGKARRSARR